MAFIPDKNPTVFHFHPDENFMVEKSQRCIFLLKTPGPPGVTSTSPGFRVRVPRPTAVQFSYESFTIRQVEFLKKSYQNVQNPKTRGCTKAILLAQLFELLLGQICKLAVVVGEAQTTKDTSL